MSDEAAPVKVVNPDPLPVKVVDHTGPTGRTVQHQATDPSLPARTTFQQDLVAGGQRRINLIWEFTQATVTVMITCAAIYCAVSGIEAQVVEFAFIAIISTYYARTNHTKIGGVGSNDTGR